MCPLATSMFVTNITLLWWALDNVLPLVVIKPKAVTEALQWRSQRRVQAQSYVNQTELTSELTLQC